MKARKVAMAIVVTSLILGNIISSDARVYQFKSNLATRSELNEVIFDTEDAANNRAEKLEVIFDLEQARSNEAKEVIIEKPKSNKSKVNYVQFNPYDITQISNISVDKLRQILKDNNRVNMAKCAQDFIDAEELYGVNAFVLAGIGVVESTDFTSHYAITRNNGFGIAAYDSNPNNAASFKSKRHAIMELAKLLKSGQYYVKAGRKSIWEINSKYCSDPKWADRINGQIKFWSKL